MANEATPDPSPDHEIRTRAWEHALHEENVFNTRMNFFLVAEAMLLVFFITSTDRIDRLTLIVVAICGALMTGIWAVINHRQLGDLEKAKAKLRGCVFEYSRYHTEAKMDKARFHDVGNQLLAYAIPIIVLLIWAVIALDYATRVTDAS